MPTNTLSVKECLSFGWKTFKARPWFFVGTFVLYAVVQIILSSLQNEMQEGIGAFVSFLLSLVISTLLYVGLINIYLKAHTSPKAPSFKDFWYPASFWRYLGASILLAIIVIVGLILIVVPGIYAALAFAFTGYLVVDKSMNPIAALKESARLTKGNRGKLLLLGLAILGLSILGMIPLFLGLLVIGPVSMLAGVHAYRVLQGTTVATPILSPEAV